MALIKCSECGKIISDKAAVCPSCGAPNTNNTQATQGMAQETNYASIPPHNSGPSSNNKLLIIIIFILIALVIGVILLIFTKDSSKEINVEDKKTEVVKTQDTAQCTTQVKAQEVKEEPEVKVAPKPAKSQLAEKTIDKVEVAPSSEIWAGSIGGKYKVHMKINNNTGEFYYYYDKYGPKNVLWLDCISSYGNSLTLVETNKYGEQTGMFEGAVRGNSFSGTFTNFSSGKTYKFNLHRQ